MDAAERERMTTVEQKCRNLLEQAEADDVLEFEPRKGFRPQDISATDLTGMANLLTRYLIAARLAGFAECKERAVKTIESHQPFIYVDGPPGKAVNDNLREVADRIRALEPHASSEKGGTEG